MLTCNKGEKGQEVCSSASHPSPLGCVLPVSWPCCGQMNGGFRWVGVSEQQPMRIVCACAWACTNVYSKLTWILQWAQCQGPPDKSHDPGYYQYHCSEVSERAAPQHRQNVHDQFTQAPATTSVVPTLSTVCSRAQTPCHRSSHPLHVGPHPSLALQAVVVYPCPFIRGWAFPACPPYAPSTLQCTFQH